MTTGTMTGTLLDDDVTAPTKQPTPQPVTLRTPHDASLVVKAIETRVEDLKSLAKKNTQAGYPRQAREQEGDAGALEFYVLPQFRAQQELPLGTPEQVRGGIANALRGVVRGQLVVRVMKKANEEETTEQGERSSAAREQALLEVLALRIERFAEAVASAAYEAGVAARQSSPEAIALRSLDALTGVEA